KELKIPLYMLGLGEKGQINEPVMEKMARQTGGGDYHAGGPGEVLGGCGKLLSRLAGRGGGRKRRGGGGGAAGGGGARAGAGSRSCRCSTSGWRRSCSRRTR